MLINPFSLKWSEKHLANAKQRAHKIRNIKNDLNWTQRKAKQSEAKYRSEEKNHTNLTES